MNVSKLYRILQSTNIKHKDIVLPVHLDPSQIEPLLHAGDLIEAVLALSGTLKVSADNMAEAFARYDAEEELKLSCNQVMECLHENGLDAIFNVYSVSDPLSEFVDDFYIKPSLGLSVEIIHKGDLEDAA